MSQEGSSGAQKGAKGTGQTLLGKQAGRDDLPIFHSLTSDSGRTRTGDEGEQEDKDVEWQYPGYRHYTSPPGTSRIRVWRQVRNKIKIHKLN